MITLRLRHILLFTITILLTACQFEDDQQCPDNNNVSASYINLTIAVSNGDSRGTRADNQPLAGEDGNGREAGFERENAVTGITLILYQDNTGINTAITESNNPVLEFVRYYPVSRVANSMANQGTHYNAGTGDGNHSSQIEAAYTTGPQPIGKPGALSLDLNATYHAIVVANYDLTTGNQKLTEKSSKLSDVRDLVLTKIASGSYTDAASSIGNFVMSSEEDNTLTLTGVTGTNLDGSAHTQGQDVLYDLTNQPLIIERMAARIDFWAKNATYQTKNNGGTGSDLYDAPGYVYTPVKSDGTASNDRFVLTSITPFNLNSGSEYNGSEYNGSEYLLKHLSDGLLKPETGSNYVLDPTDKSEVEVPTFLENPLDVIKTSSPWTGNDYTRTIEAMHAQVGTGLTGGFNYNDGSTTAEDVVICYPMENTLPDASPLYYYATGIVIEGDYYTDDDVSKKEHRVYFGYIRHQGESSEAYDALLPSELDETVKTSSSKPMNFGIVRNNIYRISIEKVMEKTIEPPRLKIKIEETKWRHVDNPEIYI